VVSFLINRHVSFSIFGSTKRRR